MATRKKSDNKTPKITRLEISPPKIAEIDIPIIGTSPYVQHKFSKKARDKLLQDQIIGPAKAGTKRKKEPRNIDEEYVEAMHLGPKGEYGIPATAFRAAAVRACTLTGATMVLAKLTLFIKEDFFDADEGTPLVALKGEPVMHQAYVRLSKQATSVVVRPMWKEWSATVRCQYDAEQFLAQDVVNLFLRAGLQVGIGEGRNYSKNSDSVGMGWGSFEVELDKLGDVYESRS